MSAFDVDPVQQSVTPSRRKPTVAPRPMTRPYIANPDLPERFASGAPLAELDWNTVYASGPAGYTDYPALEASPVERHQPITQNAI